MTRAGSLCQVSFIKKKKALQLALIETSCLRGFVSHAKDVVTLFFHVAETSALFVHR